MIKIYESDITEATNVFSCLSVDDYQIKRAQIMQVRGDDTRGVVTINASLYITSANFTAASQFILATLDESILWPTTPIVISGVTIMPATLYHNGAGTTFTGTQILNDVTLTVDTDGGIYVWANSITTYSVISGVDYVIIPINISYTKIFPIVAI